MGFLNTIFKRKFIERDFRREVSEHHDLSVAIEGEEFQVENISFSGVAFRSKILSQKFKLGDETIISFRVNKKIFGVSAKVTRKRGDFIAFIVTGAMDKYKLEVQSYFNSEVKGLDAVEKDTAELKYDGPGIIKWFYGDEFHELFFVIQDQKLSAFWINYQNTVFELNPSGTFKTFLFKGEKVDINYELNGESHFKNDTTIYDEMKPFVIRFIEGINGMDIKVKRDILKTIDLKQN